MCRHAHLEVADDLHHGMGDSAVVDEHVALLLQVGEEIDDSGQWEPLRRVDHVILTDQMHFPIPPFDGGQPVGHIGRESFAAGVRLLAEEEVQLVHTVDRPVFWDLGAADPGQRRE